MKKVNNTNPVYEKNLANMKLLVSCVEFQKIVKEMREHLKIPSSGFLGEDSGIEKWHENLLTESDKVLESKSFSDQEKRIKEKLYANEISRKVTNKQLGLLYEKVPIFYLQNRVSFIVDKFRLPLNYKNSVKDYILFNIIDAPKHSYMVGPYEPFEKAGKAKYVPITVFGRLYRKESDDLKKTIEMFGENLPKYRPVKDVDKKLEIEEWYENKNRLDENTGDYYQTNNCEIAENVLNNSKKNKKVYDIWRGVKALKEKRFGVGKKE